MTALRLLLFGLLGSAALHVPAQSFLDSMQQYMDTASIDNQITFYYDQGRRVELEYPDSAYLLYSQGLNLAKNAGLGEDYAQGYKELGFLFQNTDPDSALVYFHHALRIADSIKSPGDQIRILNQIAVVLYSKGEFLASNDYLLNCIAVAKTVNDSIYIADGFMRIGNNYDRMGQADRALKSYTQSLEISEYMKDTLLVGQTLANIGIINDKAQKPEEALKYYERAARVFDGKYSDVGLKVNMSISYMKLEKYQQAVDLLTSMMDRVSDAYTRLAINNNLANAYMGLDEFEQAEYYAEVSNEISEESGITHVLADNCLILAKVKHHEGKLEESIVWANRSVDYAQKYHFLEAERNAYDFLAKVYHETNQESNAYLAIRKYVAVKDSLEEVLNEQKLNELSVAHDLRDKENEIALLRQEARLAELESQTDRQQNIILMTVLTLTILILGVIGFAYRKNIHLTRQLRASNELISNQRLELEEAGELKSRFFANISHELRTPLTIINGMLYEMKARVDQQVFQTAQYSVKQLEGMIDELLDLSRIDADKLQIEQKDVFVKPLINRLVFTYESLFIENGVKLVPSIDMSDQLQLRVDETKFEKILNNLITNALKFTPEGGEVCVEAVESDHELQLIIRDTGVGIPRAELGKIFDRFYQAGNQQHASRVGTGLGLSIVKDFVTGQGGAIDVQSSEGKGTTFSLTFPAYKGEMPVSEQESTPEFDLTAIGKKRILVVEDHNEMRQYLEKLLSRHFRVITAANGHQAIALLGRQKADLIISDLMMPGMDGFELVNRLKIDPATKNIPMIVLTAKGSETDKLKLLTLGVDDYLTKPFNPEELQARLINLFNNMKYRVEWSEETTQNETITEDKETTLLQEIEAYVISCMGHRDPSVSDIAHHVAVSERQLYRRLGELTGLSPANLIREIKLRYAMEQLQKGAFIKVDALAKHVGFNNSAYFSRLFYQRFGKRPASYMT